MKIQRMEDYPLLSAELDETCPIIAGLTVSVGTQPLPDFPHERVTIRPGVIDDTAREMFRHYSPGHLARALHERTGWPLVAVRAACSCNAPSWKHFQWVQMGVRDPRGRFVDIDGSRPESTVLAQYKAENMLVLDPNILDHRIPGPDWPDKVGSPILVEVIRRFAQVIEQMAAQP